MFGLSLAAMFATPGVRPGSGGLRQGGGGFAMLISNVSVQKELKLDDEQIDKAKELPTRPEAMTEMREKMQGLSRKNGAPRGRRS